MNILHISTYSTGGGAPIAAHRHCFAMRKAGLNAKMLVYKGVPNEYTIIYPYKKMFPIIGTCWQKIKNLAIKTIKRRGVMYWPDNDCNLSQIKEVKEADIIYIHWVDQFIGLKTLEYILNLGKPVVWYMHDMWPFTGGCHHSFDCEKYMTDCNCCPDMIVMKKLTFNSLRDKAHIIAKYGNIYPVAPSVWLTDCARKSSVFKGHQAFTIPNVIDTDTFVPLNKTTCKKNAQLPLNKKIVLFNAVDFNNIYKGPQYLVKTISQLDESYIEFAVIGNADLKMFPKKIHSRIHLLGYVASQEQMVEIYNTADVLLITSMAENFPNVVIEAMACGIPVVGFATGGIKDQIKHKENGWLSPQGDVDDLVEGVRWVLNKADYSKLKEKSRAYVEKDCSFRNVLSIHKPILDLVKV